MNPRMKSKERDDLVRMEVKRKLRDLEIHLQRQLETIVKPAPKWMPKRIYSWMASLFLNL
jgi:hypothetical protein